MLLGRIGDEKSCAIARVDQKFHRAEAIAVVARESIESNRAGAVQPARLAGLAGLRRGEKGVSPVWHGSAGCWVFWGSKQGRRRGNPGCGPGFRGLAGGGWESQGCLPLPLGTTEYSALRGWPQIKWLRRSGFAQLRWKAMTSAWSG